MVMLSPRDEEVVRLTDKEVECTFLEFPQDTFFMEAMAINEGYKQGLVGVVPVLRNVNGKKEGHIYEISAPLNNETDNEGGSSKHDQPKHLCGPVKTMDGDAANTLFGCALTSKGILYICVWNKNLVIRLDLNSNSAEEACCATMEIPVACPNDVSIDPNNEDILYTAGGQEGRFGIVNNASYGRVTKVVVDPVNNTFQKSIVKEGLTTLAGIEVIGDTIIVAALQDLMFIGKNPPHVTTKVWDGDDGKGNCWLADNVCVFNNNQEQKPYWLCPAYNSVSTSLTSLMKLRNIMCCLGCVGQVASAVLYEGKRDLGGIVKAMSDPEVDVSLNWTYVDESKPPAPIRFMIGECSSTDTDVDGKHFEIDLVETRKACPPWMVNDAKSGSLLGMRYHFCEQVTHMSQMKNKDGMGFITCINFQQPRIMFMKDTVFQKQISKLEGTC